MKYVGEPESQYVQRVANTLGLTHEQLGVLIGRSQPTVTQIVKGDRKEVDPLIMRRLEELMAAHVATRELRRREKQTYDFCDVADTLTINGTWTTEQAAAHIPTCAICMMAVLQDF